MISWKLACNLLTLQIAPRELDTTVQHTKHIKVVTTVAFLINSALIRAFCSSSEGLYSGEVLSAKIFTI